MHFYPIDAFWFEFMNRTMFVIIPEKPYTPYWFNEVVDLLYKLSDNDGA